MYVCDLQLIMYIWLLISNYTLSVVCGCWPSVMVSIIHGGGDDKRDLNKSKSS